MLALFDPRPYRDSLIELGRLIRQHRILIWAMTKGELRRRHAGQALGTVWALGHPLFLMALYVFLFAFVFPGRAMDGEMHARSLVAYVLAGLIPWLSFSEALGQGTRAIIGESSLVKQVVFPIEVLPIRSALIAFTGQLISTPVLLLVLFLDPAGMPGTAALLTFLLAVQLAAMVGASYALSALTVYFRDLQELVRVFVTAGLFLAPILYQPAWVDRLFPPFGLMLELNPFTHLVWCYQDAAFFGQIAHPWSWLIVSLLSVLSLSAGYRLFRRLKPLFGDAL